MKNLRRFLPDSLIVALLLAVSLAFFWQQTFGGRTVIPSENLFQWQPYTALSEQYQVGEIHNPLVSDLILQYYTWRHYALEQISQGQFPLWQPNILAGAPYVGAGQTQMMYPPGVIFLILPLWLAFGWYVALHVGLAGVNVYILSRTLRIGRAGGLIAALTYQLSGFLLATIAFPTILAAAAWLPLELAIIEKIMSEGGEAGASQSARRGVSLQGKTVLWVIIGAVGLGMAALAGHVEATYFTLLVMGFYAGWRLVTSRPPSPPAPLPQGEGRPEGAGSGPALPGGEGRPEGTASSTKGSRRTVDVRWLAGRAVWLLAMVGLGLALAAPQIAPSFEMATRSFREGTVALKQVKGWAFQPRQALGFVMPNFYGNPTHHQFLDVFTGQWTPITANANGDPISTTEWGLKNYVEGAAYSGILPVMMALLGAIGWARAALRRRASAADGPETRPTSPLAFIVLGLLSVSFIFGTPTYDVLYYALPFFNQSHSPFRWVWPLTLCVAVLAGYGVRYLAPALTPGPSPRGRGENKKRGFPGEGETRGQWGRRVVSMFGWGGVAAGAAILIGLVIVRLGYASFAGFVESAFTGLALASNAFPDSGAFFSYEAANIGILGLMLIASGCVLLLYRSRPDMTVRGLKVWQAAAAIVIVADLFIGSWGLTPASDPKLLEVVPPSIQWLKDRQAENANQPFRFMAYIAPGSTKTMNANTGWLNGLEDVSGYDSLLPAQYVKYMKVIMPQGDLPYNRIAPIYAEQAAALDSPLLDLLGVKYVISESEIASPRWEQVYRDDAVRLYENTGVMPRAFTLPLTASRLMDGKDLERLAQNHDVHHVVLVDGACTAKTCPLDNVPDRAPSAADAGPAEITQYRSGELLIDAALQSPGWLVVADTYFSGWRAWMRPMGGSEADETEVPIYLVDGNFRGVQLEPGRWTVRMKYSPDSFKFGGLAALLSGLALIFLLGVWAWPRLYREEGSGSDAKRVAKNALTPILLNLFTKGILFALTFVSLRVLGPAGAGDYTYAVVIWGWFDIFTNFGLNTYLTREVARHKDQATRFLGSTTLLRLGLALLGIPAMAGFIAARQAFVTPPLNTATITTMWLLYAGLFFSTISTGLTALFYAFEKAEFPAAIQTISAFLTAALGITALLVGFGIVGLAVVSIAVNAVTLVILGTLAVRLFSLTPSPSPTGRGESETDGLQSGEAGTQFKGGMRAALRESFPLMLNHLLATLFFRIDVVLLEALKGATVVGWYRVVYTWVDAIGVIPSFFTLSLFPVMSRQAADDRPALRRTYILAIKLMTLISIPTAIFTTLLAGFLVNVLGGSQYLPHGAIALQIFIWAMIVGWMNSVTQYVIIALDRQRTLTIAFVVGAVFNVVANLVFIPLYSYVAASVISIFSEAVLWTVFYVILSRAMGRINWAATLWRIFVAGLVCAGATFGLAQINMWLALVAGVAAYGGLLIAVRPLDAEESRVFAGLLPEGIRRRVGAQEI